MMYISLRGTGDAFRNPRAPSWQLRGPRPSDPSSSMSSQPFSVTQVIDVNGDWM